MAIQLKKAEMKSVVVTHQASGRRSKQNSESTIGHGGCMTVDRPRNGLTRHADAGIPLVLTEVYPALPLCGALLGNKG